MGAELIVRFENYLNAETNYWRRDRGVRTDQSSEIRFRVSTFPWLLRIILVGPSLPVIGDNNNPLLHFSLIGIGPPPVHDPAH